MDDSPTRSKSPLLEVRELTVRFPGVLACDGISVDLRPGEVHAVVGENGAGKSTLMHSLVGLVRPSAGTLRVEGRPVPFDDPRSSREAGVAMVFQRFRLVSTLTVAQNVVLGLEDEPFFLSPAGLAGKVRAQAQELGLDPEVRVGDLSEGQRQRVEILRVLYRGARILILDEPTSVLSPQESEQLIRWMRERAAAGTGIFLITHKLPEVLAAADRVTVLRGGRVVVAGLEAADCTTADLSERMVGEAGTGAFDRAPAPARGTPAALEMRDVELDLGPGSRLQQVNLRIARGEIVGVAGVSGNGQDLLAHLAAGLLKPDRGQVSVGERDLTGAGTRAFLDAGVRYAPEDRDHLAVAPDLSVAENGSLRVWRRLLKPLRRVGPSLAAWSRDLVRVSGARVPSLEAAVSTLSGGNLQKLIMARECAGEPRLLVIHQPTQGLDVAAAAQVRRVLLERAADGCGVLLLSSDLDEVMALSHRIRVLYGGRLLDPSGAGAPTREQVGLLMAGGTVTRPREEAGC